MSGQRRGLLPRFGQWFHSAVADRREGARGSESSFDGLLILLSDRLVDPASGRSEELVERGPEAIGRAARRLFPSDRPRLVLALPGYEFFAQHLVMPGVAVEQLHDAIQLQLPELLPGVDRPMALQVVPPSSEGGAVLALWFDAEKAESLFHAFDDCGLFLAALAPRLALTPPDRGQGWCCEREDGFLACANWSDGAVVEWMSTAEEDLALEALAGQWREAFGEQCGQPEALEGDEVWAALKGQRGGEMPPLVIEPRGARQHIAAQRRLRRRRLQTVVALVMICLVVGAWGVLSGRMAYFEGKLERLKVEAREASRLRGEVVEIETRLGPVRDFPDQDVAGVIKLLNERIPHDSWIERLQINDGVVELEGYSPDPAGLVAALAEVERFEDVAFSRATRGSSGSQSGDRFGIRFRLAGVDVTAYLQEHFPLER